MLPRNVAKSALRRVLGCEDLRGYARVKKLAIHKRLYRNPITPTELRTTFEALGVKPKRTIWIQSSWNEFYNFQGTPRTVIDMLLDMIGPEGTLVMPAIPINKDPDILFEVDRAPVETGLICEYFRRYKGIRRSIHLDSSVIALGPQAEFLTKDHHLTETAWDPPSPYARLCELDTLCIGAGVGAFPVYLTPLHVVEAVLRHEILYFRDLFHGYTEYEWKTEDGRKGSHRYLNRHGSLGGAKLARHYPTNLYTVLQLSNLEMWSITAKDAISNAIELGRKGITMYAKPRPVRSAFRHIDDN